MRLVPALLASAALLLIVLVLAIASGSVAVPLGDVLGAIRRGVIGELAGPLDTIVWGMRLPRVLLAALTGAALASAGALYQGLFRNPLADPYLLGTASGAALGVTAVAVLGAGTGLLAGFGEPLLAFLCAVATMLLVMVVARHGASLPTVRLILAGVVIGSMLSAATSFLLLVGSEQTAAILARLLGGFALTSWADVGLMLAVLALVVALTLPAARLLDVLQLGEEEAAQLGVPVEALKLALLALATLLTAVAVSLAGVIGFVGLITPHAVRLLFGPAHLGLLTLGPLWGAVFMVLADLLARGLLSPLEFPVGIVTALVGGPFFLVLLRRPGGGT